MISSLVQLHRSQCMVVHTFHIVFSPISICNDNRIIMDWGYKSGEQKHYPQLRGSLPLHPQDPCRSPNQRATTHSRFNSSLRHCSIQILLTLHPSLCLAHPTFHSFSLQSKNDKYIDIVIIFHISKLIIK